MSSILDSIPRNTGGFLVDLSRQVRLILALMADRRVPTLLKLIPVASVIYLVVPLDFMPVIPVDDAAVLWFGMSMFIQFAPQQVVAEHRLRLEGSGTGTQAKQAAEVVIDVQPREVNGSDSRTDGAG